MAKPMELRSMLEGALVAALTAVLALIGFYLPPLQIITNLIWTIPLVVVVVRHDLRTGVMAAVVASILVFLFSDPLRGLFLVIQSIGIGLLYGHLFKLRYPAGRTVLLGSVVSGLSTFLLIGLSSLILGVQFNDIGNQLDKSMEQAIEFYRQTGLLERLTERGISEEMFREQMQYLVNLFKILIPGGLILSSIAVAILNFVIARLVLKRLKISVPEVPPFRYWQLPWYSTWGFIAGLALLLVGDHWHLTWASNVGKNVLYIYFPFLLVNGTAVAVYYYKKYSPSPLVKALLIFTIVLFPSMIIMFLLLIGLFDPLFNYRKLGVNFNEGE
ncbi:YybS family protein [Calderihabitans maritimus]|uniref:Predicted membrane protein n=1 Tax=Calderihabitans maritimus TaxID=1246530 RepID=A0A1Z5HVZ0_9FIRM|nr:YybS family protein [Calderihabitans maritimus]GAW93713.1 predicted membrane protein [Calderihabitans maritimus]